jgi:hypothetical protein
MGWFLLVGWLLLVDRVAARVARVRGVFSGFGVD